MPMKANCTLLIVDDSPEDRHVFMDHIQRNQGDVDYRFLEAEEVGEALTLCEQVAVDCVLVDYRLPDASGLDFLRRLFTKRERASIGVVFVTGMGSEEIAVSAMREGAVDYVSKSNMRPEALMRALEHARGAVEAARKLEQAEHARMVAQSEQMRSEGDLQRLIESIRDYAIITLDLGGRVARWGAGARRLLGYHDHEAVGLRFGDMLHRTDDGALLPQEELESARTRPINSDGRWFVRRDGGVFWGTSLLSPIDGDLGDVCGFALVIHDISAWRDVTQCLRPDMADRDQRSLQLADDLRAPLLQVQTGIEQLQQSHATATQNARTDALATLAKHVQRLHLAVDGCVAADGRPAVTVGEHVEHTEQVEQVSLAEVLKHYTTMATPAQSAPVALQGEASYVRGPWDAHMLLQAFENIFAHARNINPDIAIEVRPYCDSEQVSVAIVFNGQQPPGAPMFLPYAADFRAEGEPDLRLAVARFIIESLGGHVGERHVSRDSVGLSIYLPLTESAHA